MPIRLQFEGERLLRRVTFGQAGQVSRVILLNELDRLGQTIVDIFRDELEPRRYTGQLSESVTSRLTPEDLKVEIGPTLKRGKWDAGLLLELGTGQNLKVPWGPIQDWAESRGFPPGPVWNSIRLRGTKSHPFLNRVFLRSQGLFGRTAERVGELIASALLRKGKRLPADERGL